MHILKNVIEFANQINISKPRVAILSGTEDPIESMPSSMEAKEIMERAINEKINAYVQGPLAFDNAVSPEAAAIKNISNEVAGKADILLVPNLETGNALSKIMVHFMGACAAGFIVGGKVPVVVTSRADSASSRLASIAASVIASQ
jgi:phosphate acetyltransferase